MLPVGNTKSVAISTWSDLRVRDFLGCDLFRLFLYHTNTHDLGYENHGLGTSPYPVFVCRNTLFNLLYVFSFVRCH